MIGRPFAASRESGSARPVSQSVRLKGGIVSHGARRVKRQVRQLRRVFVTPVGRFPAARL
jgi:hypothetical protein